MSSNIRINKICVHCRREFEARKTTTKTCSDYCAKMLYKAKLRTVKIESVKLETEAIKRVSIEEIKCKEFLTVPDLAKLLNCSKRTIYYLIERGNIKAVNIAQRKMLIKRSEIDKLFS